MTGPQIVAALAGSALLLTVGWNYAVKAVLGPGIQQAVGNIEALSAGAAAGEPFAAGPDGAGRERLVPDSPGAPQREARPFPRTSKPPRTVGGAPSGWHVDESWGQSPARSTSRNAGP